MRYLVIFFLFALTACGDGRALVTGSGSVDQRDAAQERLFTAQQCLRRSSLASLRDLNTPDVCGLENRTVPPGMFQTTGVTSDGVRVLIGYANGDVYVDTCTTTGPTTLACDASVGNQQTSTPEIKYLGRFITCGNVGQAVRAINDLTIYDVRNLKGRATPAGSPDGCWIEGITVVGRDQFLGQATTADGWRVDVLRGTQQNGFVVIYIDPTTAVFTGFRPNS